MPRPPAGSDATERRRKRLKFRSWHRGTREMDLLLGPFAEACVDDFDAARLAEYEHLLELPEPTLFGWLLGCEPIPESARTRVLAAVIEFHARRHAR